MHAMRQAFKPLLYLPECLPNALLVSLSHCRAWHVSGDYTPDMRALLGADVIICTPEKWDGISRSWQNRAYVKKVALLVIDEIHLLGADRSARCLLQIHVSAEWLR